MQQADFDHNMFDQNNSSDADKNLLVKFFFKPREDAAKSLEEGRPVFKEVEYIDIRVAGKRDPLAVRPATLADKQRFPRHYEAFKQRVSEPMEGTPLTEWGVISRTQAEELAFMNVKTVEQLASMPDTNAQKFMGGYGLKQKAQDWLEATKETAEAGKYKDLADKMQAENDELKAQIAALTERLNSLESEKETAESQTSESEAPKQSKRRRRANTED